MSDHYPCGPMLRLRLACVLATAGLLFVGCGGKSDPPPAATARPAAAKATATPAAAKAKPTASPVPTYTDADDIAACGQLEQTINAASALIQFTTEGITQATTPTELAKKVGTAQKSLLDSAKVVEIPKAPKELVSSQRDFVQGLRMFAADFGRGKAAAGKGDMAKATQLLTDKKALRQIQVSAKRIDDRCGA